MTDTHAWNDSYEWLETDGLGGFACGTVGGIRTRRYHGLLLVATTPPTGRVMLVNGAEVYVTTPAGTFPLSAQRYDGQVVHPDGFKHLRDFQRDPWPKWKFTLPDGTQIEQELVIRHEAPIVLMSWRVIGKADGVTLSVRPLLSGRDYHALHQENHDFNFAAEQSNGHVRWQPYTAHPAILAHSNGNYTHDPLWYRRFFYQEEWLRGFDASEDLASPGEFRFDLSAGEAVLVLAARGKRPVPLLSSMPLTQLAATIRTDELRRRSKLAKPLHRAADQYIVRRGGGKTIVAGYPWFVDWGRDSFVSLRGLYLSTGRLDDARQILLSWAGAVSQGMLPNRFTDAGEAPEYNSVDASLWYVIAVHEFLVAAERTGLHVTAADVQTLHAAVESILSGYAAGTRYGIRLDDDGLLAAGEAGVQLTWMDARVDGRVITPRIGKPVEIQALWLNALSLASTRHPQWRDVFDRGRRSFLERFWIESDGTLCDVVDVDHRAGTCDRSFRPNQIFAVGGLPLALLDGARARRLVDAVEERLLTPIGLRTLAPGEAGYSPRYVGGSAQRDSAYHQGTVWPWLMGAFVEAWVRVRGSTTSAKREARHRFVEPLLRHLDEAGLGHVCEIADAEAPHQPRGCPFQAWSVAELLRLTQDVLHESHSAKPTQSRSHPNKRELAHLPD